MSIKPLGSERLQGDDKLRRIIEISNFGKATPSNLNENTNSEYKLTLADGSEYQIVREKVGYIIKKTISESVTEYIDPIKGRKYYPSYSQALKRLNLMAKEMNTLFENKEGISLFSEQKKFVLKNPNAEKKNPEPTSDVENVPPPPPEPAPEGDMSPEPAAGEPSDMPPPPPPSGDMGGEEPSMGPEMGADKGGTPEENHDDEVSFKVIQKLTGKLGQKLRAFSSGDDEKMSSKDIKYVINSILSALDLNELADEDKEEILTKFEDVEADEDINDEGEEGGGGDFGGEDMGIEEPSAGPEGGEEIPEGEMTEEGGWPAFASNVATHKITGAMEDGLKNLYIGEDEKELDEDDAIKSIANEMFTEQKVENILTKYFVVEENEKKFNEKLREERKLNKRMMNAEVLKHVNRLSESLEQEDTARSFLKGKSNVRFLGRTNKKNLVFEIANRQYKITVGGEII